MAAYIDFDDLKARVSIDKVVQMLGLTMRKSSAQIRCQCPACKGDDRSLAVTVEKNSYYCFQERKGGDQIALAAHVLGVDQRKAAEKIASHFGLTASPSTAPAPSSRPEQPRSGGMKELEYLDPLHEAVEALGISPTTADLVGIGFANKGTMSGRVLLPIRMPTGELIGYCGIAMGKTPEYLFPDNLEERATNVVTLDRRKG